MRLLAATVLAMLLASGCASKQDQSTDDVPPADFDELDLAATATTGIIRGIVVDEAIRPIPGATVSLQAESARTTETAADGAFGFDGLEPGTYFLAVRKAGYVDVQQSADVVAGVAEPGIVKVLLTVDGSFVAPYVEEFVFEGFIECSVTTPVIAGAVCSFGEIAGLYNLTNDNFVTFIPVASVPLWIQHELIWEATQNTGDQFNLAARTSTYEQNQEGSYESGIKGKIGTSPLLIQINTTEIEEEEIGLNGTGLAPAVFAGGMAGSEVCVPPGGGICTFGSGATLSQRFSLYTHVFHGYTPPEEWRFSSGEPIPQPPQ